MTEGNTMAGGAQVLAEEAFVRLTPEMAAVPEGKLLPLNVDVEAVTAIVLGALPRISALRGQLLETYAVFDVERFDRLELYPWCLQHAQTLYLSASRKAECSAEVVDAGIQLRRRLRKEARMLAERGWIDGTRLAKLSRGKGYLDLSTDLGILLKVLQDAWPQLEGRCPVPAEDLATAADLTSVFVRAASRLQKTPEEVASAQEWRRRAFTILHRAYNRIRLAVLYLRVDHGDGERIAPPLFPERNRRRRSVESARGASAPGTTESNTVNELDSSESPFVD